MLRSEFLKSTIALSVVVFSLILAGGAFAQAASFSSDSTSEEPTIIDVAYKAGTFDILLTAIDAAGLTDTLSGSGPFTLFAPTDSAFGKLDKKVLETALREENLEQLTSILKLHVAPGRVGLVDAFDRNGLATLGGSEVAVTLADGQFFLNEVKIVANDIESSNGVIHVIDEVLLPEGISFTETLSTSARRLIMLAIERGVPLFNGGDREACAAVYEIAAQSLLSLGGSELPPRSATALREALAEAEKEHNETSRAWILRRALDRTYLAFPDEEEISLQTSEESTFLIDDFSTGKGLSDLGTRWQLLTDRVMGGISDARTRYETLDGKPSLRMQGAVSLENNGGFVQIALPLDSDGQVFDASEYDGVRLWVRGNGEPYYVHLRTTQNILPWQYYSAAFPSTDEWRSIDIPFDRFDVQNSRDRLDTSRLKRIAVVGAKKEFEADIAVGRIEFYRS